MKSVGLWLLQSCLAPEPWLVLHHMNDSRAGCAQKIALICMRCEQATKGWALASEHDMWSILLVFPSVKQLCMLSDCNKSIKYTITRTKFVICLVHTVYEYCFAVNKILSDLKTPRQWFLNFFLPCLPQLMFLFYDTSVNWWLMFSNMLKSFLLW